MRNLLLGVTRAAITALLTIGAASGQHYQQTNLVSNLPGGVPVNDVQLVNAWGLARSSASPWWVADNGTGLSTLYNGDGVAQTLVVTVPGAPTGTVFNGSADFEVAPGKPARFLFVSEDGTISGWNPTADPTHALVAVTTPGAVYKGAAIAMVNGHRRLFATDFHGGHIDIFDASFHKVGEMDGGFPRIFRGRSDEDDSGAQFQGFLRGLAPFGIQNIGGNLFVSFAKPDAAGKDDVAGPGNGAVAIFTASGRPVRVFAHTDDLNAPWGMALAPGDFGAFSHHLLVGQFGSGEILAYNPAAGRLAGKMLGSNGEPLRIDGLWALSFGNGRTAGPATTLFFTAGPNDEEDGLFGTVTPVASELLEGNGN